MCGTILCGLSAAETAAIAGMLMSASCVRMEVLTLNKDEIVFWACVAVLMILAFAGGGLTVFFILFILFGGI